MAESNGSFFLYIFNRGRVLFCAAFSVCVLYGTSFLSHTVEDKEYIVLFLPLLRAMSLIGAVCFVCS